MLIERHNNLAARQYNDTRDNSYHLVCMAEHLMKTHIAVPAPHLQNWSQQSKLSLTTTPEVDTIEAADRFRNGLLETASSLSEGTNIS